MLFQTILVSQPALVPGSRGLPISAFGCAGGDKLMPRRPQKRNETGQAIGPFDVSKSSRRNGPMSAVLSGRSGYVVLRCRENSFLSD